MAVSPETIAQAVKPNTRLVTIMLANNETGALQPLQQIATSLRAINDCRPPDGQIYVHSDIAQAVGKVEIDFDRMQLDYATIVGHKIYGPRFGALLRRKAAPLHPLFYGGGQENGLRPGTLNTPMVLGLCEAIVDAAGHVNVIQAQLRSKRDRLERVICDALESKVRIRKPKDQLPNTISASFPSLKCPAADLLRQCKTFCASTGSACHSGCTRPSQVLLNSGYSQHDALRTVRLSVGVPTDVNAFEHVVAELCRLVQELS